MFASKICCSTQRVTLQVTAQRYWRMNLVVSVFPAPLSPLMMHDWFLRSSWRYVRAASAVANTWGGISIIFFPLYLATVSCRNGVMHTL